MRTLNVISGPAAGQKLEIEREIVIGRENADVTIEDAEMSRRHAAVRPLDDGVEVEDLGSLNGTFVGERKLEAPARLSADTVIRLGTTRIELKIEEEAEEPPPEIPQPDVTVKHETIPQPDVTAKREVVPPTEIPDPDVTAPRKIPEPDVTAKRDVVPPPDVPEPDATAPRKIPEPDVTAPRQIPDPDVTAKREVVAPPPDAAPPAERKGGPSPLLIALGVALVVLLVVLVLLLA